MMIWMGNVGGDYSQADWNLEDPPTGLRTVTRHVAFNQPFTKPPAVILGLTSVDAAEGKNLRVRVEAANVSTTGFNVKFTTWFDSITYGLRASWIAVGA
jgi:hypothetical protein